MINPRVYLLLGLLFITISSCSTRQNSIKPIQTIVYSEYGAEMEATRTIIASEEEFENVFKKVNENVFPLPEVPNIDFTKKSVVFLHFGTFRYGGISYEVEEIIQNKDELVIKLLHGSPKKGEPSLTVITHPFMFIEIPKLASKIEHITIIKSDKN